MTKAQHTILGYMDSINVGAFYLNTPTYKGWVFKEDLRRDAQLAEISCATMFFRGFAQQSIEASNEEMDTWLRSR